MWQNKTQKYWAILMRPKLLVHIRWSKKWPNFQKKLWKAQKKIEKKEQGQILDIKFKLYFQIQNRRSKKHTEYDPKPQKDQQNQKKGLRPQMRPNWKQWGISFGQFPRRDWAGNPPPPQKVANRIRLYSCSTLACWKWKHIMRFEIRYFFLEKKVSNFKPHYILPLPNGMVAHALTYWPNVGPSLPQPPNLTSLR